MTLRWGVDWQVNGHCLIKCSLYEVSGLLGFTLSLSLSVCLSLTHFLSFPFLLVLSEQIREVRESTALTTSQSHRDWSTNVHFHQSYESTNVHVWLRQEGNYKRSSKFETCTSKHGLRSTDVIYGVKWLLSCLQQGHLLTMMTKTLYVTNFKTGQINIDSCLPSVLGK